MSRQRQDANFFVSRAYQHEREDENANPVETVDRPDSDVTGRSFDFWPDKDTRDAGKEAPSASFVAAFADFPLATLQMLAAIGLNVRLNQQIDTDSTIEDNMEALQSYYKLLCDGTLREAGVAGGDYVPMFVTDFRRFLELQCDGVFTVAEAQRAINKAQEQMAEEDFNAWKAAIRKQANFQKAKVERMEAKANKAKDSGEDLLSGLLDVPEVSEEVETETA